MDQVGAELGHGPLDRGIGQTDRELLVSRDPEAPRPEHRDLAVGVGTGAGGNDQQLVPAGEQPIRDVANRVRHPIDLRQEGLSDHHDAHSRTFPTAHEPSATLS